MLAGSSSVVDIIARFERRVDKKMYVVLSLLAVILLLILALGGICWYFSTRLLHRTSGSPSSNIVAIDATTITLKRTKNTQREGIFGIHGTTGQAIVGPILSSDPHRITRQLLDLTGSLQPQTRVAWNTTVYGGALLDRLQLPIEDITFSTPFGAMPAWYVPGTRDTWVILVHGATGTREQALRVFNTLAERGFPLLAINYRNDKGAPSSSDGLSRLGDTEWEDVEASVLYAREQGAKSILLYGWSMGGTIVEIFLARSSATKYVCAVILDSPILDWRAALKSLTKKNALPLFFATLTERIIALRTGVQLNKLTPFHQPRPNLPTLLFHGIDDTTAPITVSDAFAAAHSVIVYHRMEGADHTQCWNAQRAKYEAELRLFLNGLELN